MILVDTGPLVAAAIVKQPDHRACVDLFTGLQLAGRPLLVPATVVAETGFMLEKLGAVIGVSNLHIYAAMRGQSLEDFRKTRNAPGALYSVAGTDATRLDWNHPGPGSDAGPLTAEKRS